MKDISSPTVMVMLFSFFTDIRSLAEMNQRKDSVQLPTQKLSGPLRCSWVLEQPHRDDRYDRGSIRNPQPWEWYPEVWQDSRIDTSCPCSGNQILPYKFKLLLQ